MNVFLLSQIILGAVSVVGVAAYWFFFTTEQKRRDAGLAPRPMPLPLKMFLTISVVGVWFVMPFLPQPLLGNSSEGMVVPSFALVSGGRLFQILLGLPLAAGGLFAYVKLMKRNAEATASDYAKPVSLITSGAYGYVRHPVVVARFIGTCGVVLFTGAAYTACLLPLLALTLFATAYIEEKMVLEPCFGARYALYSQKVPAFWARPVVAVALVIFVGFAASSI